MRIKNELQRLGPPQAGTNGGIRSNGHLQFAEGHTIEESVPTVPQPTCGLQHHVALDETHMAGVASFNRNYLQAEDDAFMQRKTSAFMVTSERYAPVSYTHLTLPPNKAG